MKNIFNRLRIFQIHWSILIALVLFFLGVFCVISFDSAVTLSEAIIDGEKTMPSSWEAGVSSNGEYYQWYTPENHPVFYFISWIIVLSAVLFWINAMVKIRIEINEYIREQELRKISNY